MITVRWWWRLDEWLTAAEAAARLGVKRATVYAYVSRGELGRRREGRTSYFRAADVDRLLQLGRRPSLTEFGKTSRLSTMADGALHYRGMPLVELVERPFESIAHFLWTGRWADDVVWVAEADSASVARQTDLQLPDSCLLSDRLRVILAAVAATDRIAARTRAVPLEQTAGTLLRTIVEAMRQRSEPAGATMAALLWSRLSPLVPTEDHLHLLNTALVLLADHGLASSTYAAQLAASASADLHGVVAAGLSVGSSALLGTSTAVEVMLDDSGDVGSIVRRANACHRETGELPGFGHPLHRNGDLRASHLLTLLTSFAAERPGLQRSFAAVEVLTGLGAPPPNVYLALGMISTAFAMERGASEVIFGVARSAGWIAHAIDEYGTGTIKRLRAAQHLLDRW